MIILYILAITSSLVAYFLLTKYSKKIRFGIASATFLILAIMPSVFILKIGDQAPPDAKVVTKTQIENAAGISHAP